MSDISKIAFAGILLWLVLLVGCSRLPAYSQPRIEACKTFLSANGITYRDLVVSDFRAAVLPDDLRGHEQDLNAHTSIAISTAPGAKYVFSKKGGNERQLWCGRVENLAFQALVFPEKSWWSPTLAKDQEAYVLQHEQIHFTIMEIAARQLNLRIARERDKLTACETDSEGVTKKMSDTIDRWMAKAQAETLNRHRNFDEATSRRHAPNAQQWWYNRVMKELLDLAQWQ
ncbi:MAG: hypothetical protein V2B20_23360 [Pseudomonadota bacterium]